MNITTFDDQWYPSYINQTLDGMARGSASADAVCVANAIMVAGAFISQAIDHAFGGGEPDSTGIKVYLADLASCVERIAETFEEKNA